MRSSFYPTQSTTINFFDLFNETLFQILFIVLALIIVFILFFSILNDK